jgi:succinyl-CoA synthetase beta subunit
MNLHEYQGKELFGKYNLPVSKGIVIDDPENALKACRDIGGSKWVVKAQGSCRWARKIWRRCAS